MIRSLSRFAALAAGILTAGISFADEQVLYWMINGNATVQKWDGTSVNVSDFFAEPGVAAPDSTGFAARVRVIGGDIPNGADRFLDVYIPGYGVDVGGGQYGVDFTNEGGYWGAGVPTGNQSPVGAYGSPEYSFVVELGNFDSDDNWTTVAWGAAAAYNSLGDYTHTTFDLNPSSMMVWTPTFFTIVPEPSSLLLLLIGGGMFALRRRRNAGHPSALRQFAR